MVITPIVTFIVVSVVIFMFKQREKPRDTPQKKPSYTYNREEAERFVAHLDELGYFKYADSSDIDNLKKDMIDNYNIDAELTTIWDDAAIPKDFRYYSCDGEEVFEEGGITNLLKDFKHTFDKINFKCDVTAHFEEWDNENKWLNHRITINGTEYVIFKNFVGNGWGEAPERIAEILNIELSKQKKDEKIYLASGSNDGRLVFLTDELYKYIYSIYRNPYWKPLELDEWAKVMNVKPIDLT